MTSPRSTTPEAAPPFDGPAAVVPTTPKAHRESQFGILTSPSRNPTPDNSNYQQFSVQADEARGQLQNELKDRVFFVPKSRNFWHEIFSIEIVDGATVAQAKNAMQVHIDALVRFSEASNPLEARMYPHLVCLSMLYPAFSHT